MIDDKIEYPDVKNEGHKNPHGQEILGLFQTRTIAPTATPKNWFDQIVIYKNGGTKRLYVYDATNFTWSYTALT